MSVVASSGVWHSPAFRGYVDMSRDVELGAQQLFDVDLWPDSEAEEVIVRLWVAWMSETHWPARPLFHGYRCFPRRPGWSLSVNGEFYRLFSG